jgi:hypothetical protein
VQVISGFLSEHTSDVRIDSGKARRRVGQWASLSRSHNLFSANVKYLIKTDTCQKIIGFQV